MIHILGFLFIIIIAVLLIGLSLITLFLRGLFGLGRRAPRQATYSDNNTYGATNGSGYTTANEPTPPRKKLFDKDEGEYVEFEEVN